jgi:hypothetical protein
VGSSDENRQKLEEQLDRLEGKIDTKLDVISTHLGSIDVTLALQHQAIAHHIARTDALQTIAIRADKHVTMVSGAIKLLGLVATLLAVALAIHGLLK